MAAPAGVLAASLPGLGGAALVTCGLTVVAHAIWHWMPGYGVAALAAGVFGLLIDRRT